MFSQPISATGTPDAPITRRRAASPNGAKARDCVTRPAKAVTHRRVHRGTAGGIREALSQAASRRAPDAFRLARDRACPRCQFSSYGAGAQARQKKRSHSRARSRGSALSPCGDRHQLAHRLARIAARMRSASTNTNGWGFEQGFGPHNPPLDSFGKSFGIRKQTLPEFLQTGRIDFSRAIYIGPNPA
jgi:hypothetical protein